MSDNSKDRAFSLIVTAGQILLEDGAEIYRVENTMDHMAESLGIDTMVNYVIANGIFVTAEGNDSPLRSTIKQAAPGNTDLRKVELVNALSRDLAKGKYNLEQAEEKLEQIQNVGSYSLPVMLGAYTAGAGCFCYALGGSGYDAIMSAIAGLTLGVFFHFLRKWTNAKALKVMLGSMLVTLICMLFRLHHLGESMNHMIIGSLIPMIPGYHLPIPSGILWRMIICPD